MMGSELSSLLLHLPLPASIFQTLLAPLVTQFLLYLLFSVMSALITAAQPHNSLYTKQTKKTFFFILKDKAHV